MKLIAPSLVELPQYVEALKRGFWSDNSRREESAREDLAQISSDPAAFIASLDDPEAKAGPIRLADGSTVPRLPSVRRWIWDDGFCGWLNFRWQPGSSNLPSYALGHVGYAIVPWKQGQGYAGRALALLLPECRKQGLDYIELMTDLDNIASQKVITNNSGLFIDQFHADRQGKDQLRFRIQL
jgi:predicted acetyltransferase